MPSEFDHKPKLIYGRIYCAMPLCDLRAAVLILWNYVHKLDNEKGYDETPETLHTCNFHKTIAITLITERAPWTIIERIRTFTQPT